MIIINSANQHILAYKITWARSFISRLRGLTFKEIFTQGECFILPDCRMIHTFGMRFPLDIAFISVSNTILYKIYSLEPNQISPLVLKSKMVLELPAGTLLKTNTTTGDLLFFVDR